MWIRIRPFLPLLPETWSELCTRVMLTHKISQISLEEEATNEREKKNRTKRAVEKDHAVYINPISQHKGIQI